MDTAGAKWWPGCTLPARAVAAAAPAQCGCLLVKWKVGGCDVKLTTVITLNIITLTRSTFVNNVLHEQSQKQHRAVQLTHYSPPARSGITIAPVIMLITS